MNDQVNEDKNIGTTVEDRETDWPSLRLLDAEIAERVMGWFRHKGMMHGKPQDVFTDRNGSTRSVWCDCAEDFRPSIDVAAAMQVVEKMQERGFRTIIRDYEGVITWEVTFTSLQTVTYSASGNELSEVICRAALKATERLSTSALRTNGPAS